MKFFIKAGDSDVIRNCMHDIGNLHHEKDWIVTVEQKKANITQKQRAYWHVIMGIVGDDTGYTLKEMKNMIKGAALDPVKMTIGEKEIYCVPSSEDMGKDEYSKVIDETVKMALDLGIALPLPERYGV